MEIVERFSDAKSCEAELEQNEEKQRDYSDRNESESKFFYVGHGALSSYCLWFLRGLYWVPFLSLLFVMDSRQMRLDSNA
jgi:hypothetical protein